MNKIFCLITLGTLLNLSLFAQNVGIGTNAPTSKLTVNGNTAIGAGYTGTAAPANGAIIQGNVGIGTPTPAAKLHVQGNVILNTANASNGNAAILVRDNTTGEIMTIGSTTGNTKPITNITYNFTNVDNSVKINSFDTKIPVNIYTVAVIEASFKNPNGPSTLRVTANASQPSLNSYYSPLTYSAYIGPANTWCLRANYSNSQSYANTALYNGNWTLRCIVINNALVQNISPVTKDMGGTANGVAAGIPAGL
jgi:hypothetical protein